jgi:hypothetical protein
MLRVVGIMVTWVVFGMLAGVCFAGKTLKWEEIPKRVQDAVLANGGKPGPVDKEAETKDGKAVYEAQVKDKDGNAKDLVITEDRKLVETKTDEAADLAQERVDRGKKLLAGVKFSHPTEITNPYLPLSSLKQDILEGTEGGKKTRVERTAKPEWHRTFKVGDQVIESLAVEDRAFENGQLAEVALDFFAQDDSGTVYYLGEEVDEYKDGKIVSHEGSWTVGRDTVVPGVIMLAQPKVGLKFRSEDVSKDISEIDEVVSISETVAVPLGTFKDCVKIKELLADGSTEYKYYAKGIGAVREVPSDGDELLKSHNGVARAADAPASLVDVGEFGENIYDAARDKDFAAAAKKLDALKVATRKLKADLANPSADQKKGLEQLDAQIAALDKTVSAKDRQATMLAANQVTLIAAELTEPYRVPVPVAITRLDYLGRELEIWAAASDVKKLQATGLDIRSTWSKVRPAVDSHGGVAQAKKFEELVVQVEKATTAGDYARVATPILDQVDELEKVFKK